MPRYVVTVAYVQAKQLTLRAENERLAAAKAEEIARSFTNVTGAKALKIEEA